MNDGCCTQSPVFRLLEQLRHVILLMKEGTDEIEAEQSK